MKGHNHLDENMHDMKHGMHTGYEIDKGHQDMGHNMHARHERKVAHDHHDHHAHMGADFRKRFWISLIMTIPVLILVLLKIDLRSPLQSLKNTSQRRCL